MRIERKIATTDGAAALEYVGKGQAARNFRRGGVLTT
jgi:hypothetical protein